MFHFKALESVAQKVHGLVGSERTGLVSIILFDNRAAEEYGNHRNDIPRSFNIALLLVHKHRRKGSAGIWIEIKNT